MVNEDQAERQQIGRVQEYQGKDRQKHYNYPAQKQGKNEEKRFPKKNNLYKDKQAQQPDKNMRKPFVTNIMAEVPTNGCLLCGEIGHGFRSEKCMYAGSELMSSPCRNCGIGAQAHSRCLKNKGRNAGWPRTGRF